jgi:hypothetical protein
MARIRFDAQTIQNRSSGERRLRQNAPEWSSSFVKDRVLGPGVPTLAELETEHQRLRDYVLSEIASIKTTELRKFLSQRIHVVLPPFRYVVGAVRLRRAERLAPYIPFRQDKIIRLLLQHSSSF